MRLLMGMSLDGSAMVLSYLGIKFLYKANWSAVWRYFFLKCSLLCFLLPFPEFKYIYEKLIRYTPFSKIDWEQAADTVYEITRYTNKQGIWKFLNDWIGVISIAIILFSVIFIFYRQYIKYRAYRRELEHIEHREIESIRIGRKNVKVIESQYVSSPLTVGVRNSVIMIPEKRLTEEDKELVLCHEITHIRHGDLIVALLCVLVFGLHWFNPFIYYLCYEIRRVSELACDAKVMKGLDEEKRKRYGHIIITMAEKSTVTPKPVGAFGFSDNKTILKERIMEIKKTRKTSKILRTAIASSMVLCMFLSSLTVFAYSPKKPMTISDEIFGKIEDKGQDNTALAFACEDHICSESVEGIDIHAHKTFVTSDGRTYNIPEKNQITTRAICFHDYVKGEVRIHYKNADGSCETDIYAGKRCSICEYVVMGEYLGTETRVRCNH